MANLEGQPCSQEELQALSIWAQQHVHPNAHVRTAINRLNGYLLEVDAIGLTGPQWYGIGTHDLIQALMARKNHLQVA